MAACLGGVMVGTAMHELGAEPARDAAAPAPLIEAATLFGAAAALLERLGGVLDIEDRQPYEHNLALVRSMLPAATFAAAWAAGQAQDLDQAIHAAFTQQ